MEVVGQWSVAKELGFFVFGVFREGEGVVGGGAGAEEEEGVADVFAELGVSGDGGGGGGGRSAEEAEGGGGRVGLAADAGERAAESESTEHFLIG